MRFCTMHKTNPPCPPFNRGRLGGIFAVSLAASHLFVLNTFQYKFGRQHQIITMTRAIRSERGG